MYLSRFFLDPRNREVRRDLGDRYQLHRTVMSAFPDVPGGRAELGVLFRLELDGAGPMLYVQSRHRPRWEALPDGYLFGTEFEGVPETKSISSALESIQADQVLRFRLQANPRRQQFVQGGRGPRFALRAEAEIHEWLCRRAAAAGFAVPRLHDGVGPLAVALRPLDDVVGWKQGAGGQRRRLTLGAVQIDGRLRVHDPEVLRDAVVAGIGGGRAMGLGLLSLAP